MNRPTLTAALICLPRVAWGQTGVTPVHGAYNACGDANSSAGCWKVGDVTTHATCVNVPTPHRYTVAEIDRMRGLIGVSLSFPQGITREAYQIVLETRLAAYIAAGITADELEHK